MKYCGACWGNIKYEECTNSWHKKLDLVNDKMQQILEPDMGPYDSDEISQCIFSWEETDSAEKMESMLFSRLFNMYFYEGPSENDPVHKKTGELMPIILQILGKDGSGHEEVGNL